MDLSPTARVILGLLAVGPHSGYDVKAMVDKSTRFFWAASYGQIYPELKRLSGAGLIEPDDEAEGGRRRTTYRLTEAGREAFAGWMRDPELAHELRDEGLLKVFFVGTLERDDATAVLERIREQHEAKLAELRQIEPFAASSERFGPITVLRFGLGMSEFAIRWCDEALAQLREAD